jgi:HlyD family secretion protein
MAAARTQVPAAQRQRAGHGPPRLQRIEVELADSELKAPRDGRVQFRVAQPGEVWAPAARCSTWWTWPMST